MSIWHKRSYESDEAAAIMTLGEPIKDFKIRKNCVECGGKLEKTNLKGRAFPFMSLSKLTFTHNFHAMACTECDNWVLEGGRAKTLDRALILSLCDFYEANTTPKPFDTPDVTDEEVTDLPD